MQCWNCGFENIPGLQACARCGGTLNLDGVSVEPPRASRLHVANHVQRVRHRMYICLPSRDFFVRPLSFLVMEHVPWGPLAWSLVLPGLGHIKMNRRRFGWTLLSLWLVLGLITLMRAGTPSSGGWLMAMVCLHSFALISILGANVAAERLFMRILFGMLLFLSLRFFVYWPVQQFASQFFMLLEVPFTVQNNLLLDGDRLLFEGQWLRPQNFARGDLVAYRFEESNDGRYIIRAGYGVDRVVGLPGDLIQIREGVLLINGEAPHRGEEPLRPPPPIKKLDIRLTARQYAIFPTGLETRFYRGVNRELPPSLVRNLIVIPEERIVGRAILRVSPLSRFGRI